MRPTIRIQRLEIAAGLALPQYATEGAAGADIRAALPAPLVIQPGDRVVVPTGLRFEIPQGWEIQVRPRSGLARQHGLTLANSPGTIDSDYRGEVQILMINLGHEPVTLAHGDRIAQLIIAPVHQANFEEVQELNETNRGTGGFGSTGLQ